MKKQNLKDIAESVGKGMYDTGKAIIYGCGAVVGTPIAVLGGALVGPTAFKYMAGEGKGSLEFGLGIGLAADTLNSMGVSYLPISKEHPLIPLIPFGITLLDYLIEKSREHYQDKKSRRLS